MQSRIFFLILFLSNVSASLLIPLTQPTGPSHLELPQTTEDNIQQNMNPNITIYEVIQEVDIKDENDHVISNISHAIIDHEDIQANDSLSEVNGTDNHEAAELNETPEYENIANNTQTHTPNATNILSRNKHEYAIHKNNTSLNLNDSTVETPNNNSDIIDNNTESEKPTNDGHDDNTAKDNDKPENIFMIINSGNIEGLTINSLTTGEDNTINVGNNDTEISNSNNSEIITHLVNGTIHNVISNILLQNLSSLNLKTIFLILNSGTISNVRISPITDNPINSNTKPHSDNNFTAQSISKVTIDDNANHIVEMKFRSVKYSKNNTSMSSNKTDSNNLRDLTKSDNEISNVETEVPKAQNTSKIKDSNIIVKLTPESEPIVIDFHQPVNNLVNNAMDFIKRFKRDTNEQRTHTTIKSGDNNSTVYFSDLNSLNKMLSLKSEPKELENTNISNVTENPECNTTQVVKLWTCFIFKGLSVILKSFLNGNELTLAAFELFEKPFPIGLKLNLVHGETSYFVKQIFNFIVKEMC